MPPFEGPKPPSNFSHKKTLSGSSSSIVTIDVGGQIFQTSKQTLASAGPKSLFTKICNSDERTIPFFDRDPELFSTMLSLLRTGNLPSKAKSFDIQDVIFESKYYGIEELLINSLSNPSEFEAFNLEKSMILPLNGRDSPSAISATQYGSVHVAHGCKITSFDWSLKKKCSVLTEFTCIDSLLALSPKIVAAGATDISGLQIIDLDRKGFLRENLNWENATRSCSTVQAIGSSPDCLFTSFESGRRNSNCIMVYDLHDNFRPVSMIGHYDICCPDIDSSIPATKLSWIHSHSLLMASGSHSGPSGVVGNIKFWDVRSGNVVLQLKEKLDCFADVTVSETHSAIFKVGVYSGEVFVSDFRKIDLKTPWLCLGDRRKLMNRKKVGLGSMIESHRNQVFCSKEGSIELWSEVLTGSFMKGETAVEDRVFRKNLLGRASDMRGSRITQMNFGGNKMFVTRKDQQYVEVWQSSARGF